MTENEKLVIFNKLIDDLEKIKTDVTNEKNKNFPVIGYSDYIQSMIEIHKCLAVLLLCQELRRNRT